MSQEEDTGFVDSFITLLENPEKEGDMFDVMSILDDGGLLESLNELADMQDELMQEFNEIETLNTLQKEQEELIMIKSLTEDLDKPQEEYHDIEKYYTFLVSDLIQTTEQQSNFLFQNQSESELSNQSSEISESKTKIKSDERDQSVFSFIHEFEEKNPIKTETTIETITETSSQKPIQKEEVIKPNSRTFNEDVFYCHKIVRLLIDKERQISKGFENLSKIHTNRQEKLKAATLLQDSENSMNTLKLFHKIVIRSLVFLHDNDFSINKMYAIALQNTYKNPGDFLPLEQGELITIISTSRRNNKIIGQNSKGEVGLIDTKKVEFLEKDNIVDKQWLKKSRRFKSPKPKIPRKVNWNFVNIFDIDVEEVARQVTLREFEVFSKLQVSEFLYESWNKEKFHYRSPNLRYMISRLNDFTYWVSTLILQAEKLEMRGIAITWFINLAFHLNNLNNYNSLMGVLSGIHSNSIERLRFSWEEISDNSMNKLEEIDKVMTTQKSYKNYRENLERCYRQQLSAIPFVGIHLTDLTFIGTGENFYSDEKFSTILRVIMRLLIFQTKPYNLKRVEGLQEYFLNYPFLDEDTAYDLSLRREPRGCEYDDLF